MRLLCLFVTIIRMGSCFMRLKILHYFAGKKSCFDASLSTRRDKVSGLGTLAYIYIIMKCRLGYRVVLNECTLSENVGKQIWLWFSVLAVAKVLQKECEIGEIMRIWHGMIFFKEH